MAKLSAPVPAAVFVRPIKDLRETVTAENAYWQPPSALCRVVGVVPVPAVPLPCSVEGRAKWPRERSTPPCRFTPAAE